MNEENREQAPDTVQQENPPVLSKEEQERTEKAGRKERWEQQKAEFKAEKLARKQARRAKRQEKKQQRKEKKLRKKNRYKDAPLLVKLWVYVIRRILIAAVVLVLVATIGGTYLFTAGRSTLIQIYWGIYGYLASQPVTDEEIYELAPMDEEGDAAIEAMDPVDEDETWTICYYIVGSNLEDDNENDLSDMTQVLTEEIRGTNASENAEKKQQEILTYAEELKEQGLDLPEYLYEPVHPTASQTVVTEDVVVASREGAASADISEILDADLSDNINIVIQTGGATRWSNAQINPNKTQRFEVKNGALNEVANLPLQDSCDSDTLADFLAFCDENYPADHRILVLWDHGGGATGYGVDSIYGSGLTLKDLQDAFAQNYDADPENPHFDIIGFDACMMGATEVAHSLYGYGSYLVASEELEPGSGWDHTAYLQAMSDDPTMSPAAVGKSIADSYVDYYVAQNVGTSWMGISSASQFSVIDLNAAEETYQSYCRLNEKLFEDSVQDISVLSTVGWATQNATRYGEYLYQMINTIDLGNYMEALSAYYPEECGEVLEHLDEAVLYHRQSGYLSDSMGMSIYMPIEINGSYGLHLFLEYVNDISDDEATSALYYYKISGCLNEEFQDYADEQGYGTAKVLSTEALEQLAANEITLEDDGDFQITLDEQQQANTQAVRYEIAAWDEDQNTVTYYGEYPASYAEDTGVIETDFDGKWVTLGGVPLYVEVVGETDTAINFRSPVVVGYKNYYLMISLDKETGSMTLNGASPMDSTEDMPSAGDVYPIDKTTISLEVGDRITPIYEVYDCGTGTTENVSGSDVITFHAATKVELSALPEGTYLNTIVAEDIRGDQYYSGVVEQQVAGGKVKNQAISERFIGRAY